MRKAFESFPSPLKDTCTPHTCSCVFSPILMMTDKVETWEPWTAGLVDRVHKGKLEKRIIKQRTKTFNREGKKINEQYETGLGAGESLRGSPLSTCSGHRDFAGVVQTQRVKYTDVCLCVFQELFEGARSKDKYYGAIVESTCEEHAHALTNGSVTLENLRDVVVAEAQRISREREEIEKLQAKLEAE